MIWREPPASLQSLDGFKDFVEVTKARVLKMIQASLDGVVAPLLADPSLLSTQQNCADVGLQAHGTLGCVLGFRD